jgi:hypothetical protein
MITKVADESAEAVFMAGRDKPGRDDQEESWDDN